MQAALSRRNQSIGTAFLVVAFSLVALFIGLAGGYLAHGVAGHPTRQVIVTTEAAPTSVPPECRKLGGPVC